MKRMLALVTVAFLASCTTMTRKQTTYFGKEVIDVPKSYTLQQVLDKTEDILASRATNIQKFVGFMPDELPDKPGHPVFKMQDLGIGISNITFATISCGDKAVATISGQEPALKSPYGTIQMSGYKACIYPYKRGYRIYIVGTYMKNDSSGIGGFLTRMIEKGVNSAVCNGMSTFDCYWNDIVKKTKEDFPNAKILEIQYPTGGPKQNYTNKKSE
ncbi:hypothetical protein [Thermovibrio ammonificans]